MNLTKQTNFRVVIPVLDHPRIDTKRTQDSHEYLMRAYCKDIVKAIKRHLDVEDAHVESDEICKFCGYLWASALDENGRPACCDKAISEWEGLQLESQQFGAGA